MAVLYGSNSSVLFQRSDLEPMFKYIGNMHGNEVVGRQLLIYLAEYLAKGYGHDSRVTALLNNTEIFLLPTLNPDGFSRSLEGECDNNRKGRNNAYNVDLNRDFPDQFVEDKGELRQPETEAAMAWITSWPFVLSANLHAGEVVASYPFDDSESRM